VPNSKLLQDNSRDL